MGDTKTENDYLGRETIGFYDSILKTMGYKKSWDFRLQIFKGRLFLMVEYMAPDSRDPERPIVKIQSSEQLPPYIMEVGEFKAWIRRTIHKIETHESDEFLTFNGTIYREPHHG